MSYNLFMKQNMEGMKFMNNKVIIILILLLTSFLTISAHAEKRSKTKSGFLVIQSTTDGAQVFIDGELSGQIPLDKQKLVVGEHTLKISKRGFTEYIDVVQIKRNEVSEVEIDLLPIAGYLKIIGNIEGSRVFIDEEYMGNIPLDQEIRPGPHKIKVSKLGYYDFNQEVNVIAGEELPVNAELKALPMNESNPLYVRPTPPPKWYEKWWVWTAIGGGVVLLGGIITGAVLYDQEQADWIDEAKDGVIEPEFN